MTLSKSQYIRGLQCHKSLWLYKHKPELRDEPDEAQKSLFNLGHRVGEVAKELFPDGEEIVFDVANFGGMIAKTKRCIEDGREVIYEATFNAKGIFVMVDMLVKNGDKWDIYEAKASTGIKEYHLNDVSIQWYALSNAIELNRAYIVHINNQYVREGALELDALFCVEDVTETVHERQDGIGPNLDEMEKMLREDMPEIGIGMQCSDPYDCDYRGYCWKDIPDRSIFNLYSMHKREKFEMYYLGMVDYEDIPEDFTLNAIQTLQVETAKTQMPHIDKKIISDFLDTIAYPVNFFDFETFQDPVPRFDGQRPYMQIPFQYSLHILYEDGTLEHKEFLGSEKSDPRGALIEQMLQDITPNGSIVAYNQSFEKSRVKELALSCEARRDDLLALNERFVDLIVPFRRRGYYHPAFNGSFSIKSVLPAMFPNDKELDYGNLGIQNGQIAMDTFANLHLIQDQSKREKIRGDLLAYCHLDTLAMVRIWEKLHKILQQ